VVVSLKALEAAEHNPVCGNCPKEKGEVELKDLAEEIQAGKLITQRPMH
jgi:hypothetical protein